MKRKRTGGAFRLVGLLFLLVVVLTGCDGPLRLPFTNVDRPDYNNPVDPKSKVPLEQILPLIPDTNLRNIVQSTGATYNSDVEWLFVSSTSGVASLEGIQYLPALKTFEIEKGASTIDFAPFFGHARLERLRASNFPFVEIATFPAVATVRSLDISGTTGVWTLSDLPDLNLTELSVSQTNLSTLSGISRFPALESLNIVATAIPETQLGNELTVISGSLKELRITVPTSFAFLSSYPVLEFFGIDVSGGDVLAATMTTIAGYGPFRGLGFYGVGGTLDAPNNVSAANVTELEIDAIGGAITLTGTDFNALALTRLRVSGLSTFTVLTDLPNTIEELEIRSTLISNSEVTQIAQSFGSLRRVDLTDDDPLTAPDPSFDTLIAFSANAGTMAHLEEIIARDTLVTATSPTNGIPGLAVLPALRYVDLSGTPAAGDPIGSGIEELENSTNGRVFVER